MLRLTVIIRWARIWDSLIDKTTDTLSGLGSIVIPQDLTSNVTKLHEFLFGTAGYTPSSTVQTVNGNIISTVNSAQSSYEEEYYEDDTDYYDEADYYDDTDYSEDEYYEDEYYEDDYYEEDYVDSDSGDSGSGDYDTGWDDGSGSEDWDSGDDTWSDSGDGSGTDEAKIHPEKRMTAHITGKQQNNRRLMRRTF